MRTFDRPEHRLIYVIDDKALQAVREVLPARISYRNLSNENLRRFIEGALLVMLQGRFWVSLPGGYYGSHKKNRDRHARWVDRNVWPSIAEALQLDGAERERIFQYCDRCIKKKRRNAERRLRRLLSDASGS